MAEQLAGKKILVVGLGRTGIALGRFLTAQGARVTGTDLQGADQLADSLPGLQDLDIALELGVSQPQNYRQYDLIVLSPGVPENQPWLLEARAQGVPVVGELEVASWFLRRPVIAITGTNGKTTTTTLVGEMLRASGRRPLVGGNIGTPVVELLAAQETADCLVLEVSSFQLDTAPSFHPQAGALLNVTADHLDRYPDLEAYLTSKAGIFRQQEPADLAVLNADDPLVAPLRDRLVSRVHCFSVSRPCHPGAYLAGNNIHIALDRGAAVELSLADIALPGTHNLENLMAAALLALELGATPAGLKKAVQNFPGLPHRLQWVANIGGVDFYDDSKGTNVGAVCRALASFTRPVVLIAGGRDKGGDYAPLLPLIRERVKKLVLLGEAREKMAAALADAAPLELVPDLDTAVRTAYAAAAPGEVVLLSPACSSFDMFRDYADRGRAFQMAVQRLRHG